MDVRIGVTYATRELTVELADDVDRAELRTRIDTTLAAGDGVLWFVDRRGREVAVPVTKVAFVELGAPDSDRKIGFGA